MLQYLAILLADVGHFAFICEDSKASFCFCGHPPSVNAWVLEMGRNHSAHHIACAKLVRKVLLFGFGTWETKIVHQAHLPAPVPAGRDEQRLDLTDLEHWRSTGTHAC